jgi:protein-tyrosine phosphatase
MSPTLYWVPTPEVTGRIAITRRPRGFQYLDEDIASWRTRGIDVVLSLLAADEALSLGLDQQGTLCTRHGIRYLSFPMPDFSAPLSQESVEPIIQDLAATVRSGLTAAVHCHASRGRSPTLAAAVLIELGLTADDATARLSLARGLAVPETHEQRLWIANFERSRRR